jgi:ribosomal protein S7
LPDPKFQDVTVTQFVNGLSGAKSLAENILYGSFTIIEKDSQPRMCSRSVDNVPIMK